MQIKLKALSWLAASSLFATAVFASSHREAPGIAKDPAADLTDFYTFKAGGSRAATHQAFVFNVSPAYLTYAAPNWYGFDDDVLYELHIDNNGDGVEDVTYQFKFKTYNDKTNADNKNVIAYLPGITYSADKKRYVSAIGDGELPQRQTYTVTKVLGGKRSSNATQIKKGDLGEFPVALPRIGPGTTDGPNKGTDAAALTARYNAYKTGIEAPAIIDADLNYRFFAGPRNDPFFIDLGAVFNSLNIRLGGSPVDSLAESNVLSVVVEIPISEIIPDASKPFFGAWVTTSRPQAQVKRLSGKDSLHGGGYVQISRLGNPLVNELVIGYKDKDKFNATEPKDDVANFAGYVVRPQLAGLLNALYGSTGSTQANGITNIKTDADRGDLVDVFVKGIAVGATNVSRYPNATGTGDMLRVNRSLDLGGGYLEGWPLNGRKLTDNVVKTALTFLAECKVLPEFGDYDVSPIWPNHTVLKPGTLTTPLNCYLDSGIVVDAPTPRGTATYDKTVFPYVDLPFSSWD